MKQWFENQDDTYSNDQIAELKELTRKVFSITLKDFRKASGLTLKELAKLSQTSDSYLSQLENGRRNPPKPELLQKIATGLYSTPYTVKGKPEIRENFKNPELIYSTLFDNAGYSSEGIKLKETKEENSFLISYMGIMKDFYLNFSDKTESIETIETNTPPEILRLIIYSLNDYKNNSNKLEFEEDKMGLLKLFVKLLDQIDTSLK